MESTSNVELSTLNVLSAGMASHGAAFDLEERLLEYSAAIIRFAESIKQTPAGIHVAGQVLRSGTSPLPNHGEAQAAESAADFAHKLGICLKELRETRRWLLLVQRVPLVARPASTGPLIIETEGVIRIFYRSLQTVRLRVARKAGQA